MNTDGTGFSTCKDCHKTESLWNHTTTDHMEGEQLEERRNFGESSCNFGDGTDQRVQSLMFMMMMMMIRKFYKRHLSSNELLLLLQQQQQLLLLLIIIIIIITILRSSSLQSCKVRCYSRSWPTQRATAPWPLITTFFNMMAPQHLEEHNSLRSPKDTPW